MGFPSLRHFQCDFGSFLVFSQDGGVNVTGELQDVHFRGAGRRTPSFKDKTHKWNFGAWKNESAAVFSIKYNQGHICSGCSWPIATGHLSFLSRLIIDTYHHWAWTHMLFVHGPILTWIFRFTIFHDGRSHPFFHIGGFSLKMAQEIIVSEFMNLCENLLPTEI